MWPLFQGFRLFNLQILIESLQLKGLKPKNKGRTNFYECCDLTKKYIQWGYTKCKTKKDFSSCFSTSFGKQFLSLHAKKSDEENEITFVLLGRQSTYSGIVFKNQKDIVKYNPKTIELLVSVVLFFESAMLFAAASQCPITFYHPNIQLKDENVHNFLRGSTSRKPETLFFPQYP